MVSPIIPGTEWGVEVNYDKSLYFYIMDEINNRYFPLNITHNNKNNLHQFYSLIVNDIYRKLDFPTSIQGIMKENNIEIKNSFIIIVFDSDKNIVSKAKLSNPDKVEILLSSNEGGGI